MIAVHFKDVGHEKRTWSKSFSAISESILAKEAKREGLLMSSNVDVELNDDCSAGVVIVGGWRVVGGLTIERTPATNKKEVAP